MDRRWLVCLLSTLLACSDDPAAPEGNNGDPEPLEVPEEVGPWLAANSSSFDGSHLSLPQTDLAFLADMVGDARIVALGENTHGTRDFFEMKARILRLLVEEHGFTDFAIEATWPEANRLDRYVRTGEGDPAVLLSGLYFWTWNTESVLEMIEWIRSYNEAGGDVGFYGFDMQYPGMALRDVETFISEVDPDRADEVGAQLACLGAYANGPDGQFPSARYGDLSDEDRSACAEDLEAVRVLMVDNAAAYEAASTPDSYALALQSLRVATQYHLSVTEEQSRDQSMAENTVWLSDQGGPARKWVLWAHNFHVSDTPGAQGSWMRDAFGDDMVIFGFTHTAGQFTAVPGPGTHTLGAPNLLSYEWHLDAASAPRFMLDLRTVDTSAPGAEWLATSRQTRFIGCCYDPSRPADSWWAIDLRSAFDVIIHYASTGPTTVLPFQYPGEF